MGPMDPNSSEALLRRAKAGTLTWRGPALMLFARAACAVLAQAVVAAIFALRSSPTPWHDSESWLPVYGTLIDAGCLALLWRLTRREGIRLFDLVDFERTRLGRDLLLGLALGAASVCVVLSQSFGGMLAAAMLGLVVALHALRPRSLTALLVPVLAIAIVTGAAFGGLLDDVLIAVGKDPTLTGRTQIWDHSMRLLAERPLLGHSIASWWQLDIVERTGIWFSNAHNGYLQTLIDLGLIGLAVMVLQLLSTCVRSLHQARRPGGDSLQADGGASGGKPWAAAWPWCVAAFVLVYNLFEVCTVEENSLVWVLYVSASLAVRSPGARRTARRI